jgi:plastocyanin
MIRSSTVHLLGTEALARANLAISTSQSSSDVANTALITSDQSFNQSNVATVIAQASFDQSNVSIGLANYAADKANTNGNTVSSVSTVANDAFVLATTANTTANIALLQTQNNAVQIANTSIRLNSAYDTANVALATAATALNIDNQANGAYDQANTATVIAQNAFDLANTTNQYVIEVDNKLGDANVVLNATVVTSNNAYNQANLAFLVANSAYDQANTATILSQSSFNQANSVYLPSVTRLSTINAGASAYLFDQYTGNNPDIFVRAGETLAFELNVTGHPFLIRETAGGTLYNIGLTHVSTTGIVTTDSSSQAQVSGTLYWKVPAELAGNNYVYQCQVHSGMVGNVVIEIPNQANSAAIFANLAFDVANSANVLAQASFDYANTLGVNVANSLIVVSTVPANNKGSSGDTLGMVFLANDAFYYCSTDYVDGTANIWSKIVSTDAW